VPMVTEGNFVHLGAIARNDDVHHERVHR
jgi:hypothetical protein